MEPANLSGRPVGNNNGYRPLPLLNNTDMTQSQSSYIRHSQCSDFLSDSSDNDSYTDGSDREFCDEEEEIWQKKVDDKGELFFVETYSEVAESRSIYNSSSSAASSEKNNSQLHNKDVKLNEMGIISSLKWRNKKQNFKSSKKKDLNCNAESIKKLEASKSEHFRNIFKDVEVILPVKRPNFGRGVPPMEGLLGLVLKRVSRKDHITRVDSTFNDKIMIANIIPDSPASQISDINLGDVINSINDVEINFLNLEQVCSISLAVGCKQIKLGLCRAVPITPKEIKSNKCFVQTSGTFLPRMLSNSGQNVSEIKELIPSTNHLVMYLNISNCDVTDQKEDIIYQFPKSENKLCKVRGAFITLLNLLPDVVGSLISTSSLLIDAKLVHVAYASDNKDGLLLLFLPDTSVSTFLIRQITDELMTTLKFQYESLNQAFKNCSHHYQLDLLFGLIFAAYSTEEHSLQLRDIKKSRYGYRQHLPQQLPLFPDLQICVDTIINEFESSDFADMSEDHYDIRRLYSIIGVSLYYKGYLVTSHLPNIESRNIFLYLMHSGMLDVTRQHLTNIVVWKEVFLSNYKTKVCNDGRNFLLVVGKHHFLIAILLETGGCAMKAIGPIAPDPFYVERAQNTLLQLQLQQVIPSLNSVIENPVISCMAHLKKGQSTSGKSENTGSKNAMGRQEQEVLAETDSDSTSLLSTAASGTSDDTAPILGRRILGHLESDSQLILDIEPADESLNKSVHLNRQRQLPSFLDLSTIMDSIPVSSSERNTPPTRLLAGHHNVLFSYLQISHGDGIIICPAVQGDNSENSWPLIEIFKNFERGCHKISQIFNDEEESVVEQAMMFRCSKSLGADVLRESDFVTYWISGRSLKEPSQREVFVCYQDGCPQILIEIAFRLNLGMPF